jgi:hypothetical protein
MSFRQGSGLTEVGKFWPSANLVGDKVAQVLVVALSSKALKGKAGRLTG